jgi:hypothetical protein
MKKMTLVLLGFVAAPALANERMVCETQALQTARAILQIQEGTKLQVSVVSSQREDDGNHLIETYDIQANRRGQPSSLVPSRLEFVVEQGGCKLVGYSLPGAN